MGEYRYDFLLHATVRDSEDWGFAPPDVSSLPTGVEALRSECLRLSRMWRRSAAALQAYKAMNYALAMSEWRLGSANVGAMPAFVQVNRDDHCNLGCSYCRPHDAVMTEGTLKTMSGRTWRAAVRTLLPASVEFMPFCWGEPLLPSARFREACAAAEEFAVSVCLITNMNALDQVHTDLFVRHVARALVSVDTPNPERYRALRRGGALGVVETNIERLRRHSDAIRMPMPWLGVSAVIMRQNLRELPELVDWAADNGLRGVYAGRLVAHEGMRAFAENELVDLSSDEYLEVFEACSRRSDVRGIALSMHNPRNPIGAERVCPCPWLHAYVSSDGEMSFCNFSRHVVLDRLPLEPGFYRCSHVAARRERWLADRDFRCESCQSADYDGRPGVSQFRGR